MQPLYNAIGSTYCASRRADPSIAKELARLIAIDEHKRFLDLACGTGNYTSALAALGGCWHGTDISDVMLDQARASNPGIIWRLSQADSLPYEDGFFDGAMCTLAIHHFAQLLRPFKEVHRVLRGGPFIIFTAFSEQMHGYWLCHYFPEMMKSSIEQMPSREVVITSLQCAGFEVESIKPFYVTEQLQDLFLYAGKARPAQYFDPVVRANISSFASRCTDAELSAGLRMLREDIDSGAFANVASRYQSIDGDYAYVVAHKH